MTLIIGIPAFLVLLSVLIVLHEAGHFTAAKLAGIRVDEFALGFPPRLKAWRRGETVYSINAIPLGGFVRMPGENGEDDDPATFGAKPAWQRLLVLTAGPGMNIGLALILFFFLGIVGTPRYTTVVSEVAPQSPAQRAGLRVGDRIVIVDGVRTTYFDDFAAVKQSHQGERLYLAAQRGSRLFTTSVVPRTHVPSGQGSIGLVFNNYVPVTHGPVQSVQLAFQSLGTVISGVPTFIDAISHRDVSQIQGPVGIAQDTTYAVGRAPQSGIGIFLLFIGFISGTLGIFNLLPFPALDGGRIVFVLISWARRRNLNPEVEGLIHMAGMAALLMLILVVSFHDLSNWIG